MTAIAVMVRGATEYVAMKGSVPQYEERPLVVNGQAPSSGCVFPKHCVVDSPSAGVVEGSTLFNCKRAVRPYRGKCNINLNLFKPNTFAGELLAQQCVPRTLLKLLWDKRAGRYNVSE